MSDTEKTDLGGALSGISGEQLQAAVQSIAADPAFGKLLGELQGKSGDAPVQIPPVTPEMMAKLPQMMSALAPLVSGGDGGKKSPAVQDAEKVSLHDAEKRKKLLAALKPYLSGSRRDAVDSIARMTELTDLLSTLKPPGSSD